MPHSGSAPDEATVVVGPTTDGSSGRVEAADRDAVPEALGRYLVIEELGRGAMGVVLRAYDPKLQREVALKRLRVGKLDGSAQARLVREARAMARLSHPNVVAVYDVEAEPDQSISDVLVVMEYVRGTTLSRWLRTKARSRAEIIAAFVAAGRGLSAAHAQGLLHRDFKPDNVLVGSDDRVRVTDFGLARATGTRELDVATRSGEHSPNDEDSDQLTAVGTVMGTPAYMAPEQSIGGELDERADQYAFCVSLWRALTQEWPFAGNGHDELIEAKLRGPPSWPATVSAPSHIIAALRRGLEPVANRRWASLTELLAELERDPGQRRQRWVGAGVVAIAALGVWGVRAVERARATAACEREGELVAEVWHEARAAQIADAFAATRLSYAQDAWGRARPRLDAFASAWQVARAEVCQRVDIEETLPDDLAISARECLDDHRDALEALLEQLEQPDATVIQEAVRASVSLPLATQCTDENYLRAKTASPDQAVRARVVELRRVLARASAAAETGHLEQALQDASSAVDRATELGWAPFIAEAKVALGDIYDDMGRREDARVVLEDAYFAASAASRDDLALPAASLLVHVYSQLSRFDEGAHWGRLATTIVERGRSDEIQVARLRTNLANLDFRRGENALAIEQHNDALEVRERVLGAEHPAVASTLNNLGLAYYALGDIPRSIEYHERALAIWEHTLGENNPDVATAQHNLSAGYIEVKELDKALLMSSRAVAIWQTTLGPDHPNVAAGLQGLGNVYYDLHEYETALDYYERALAILERIVEPEHIDLATLLFAMGSIHAELNRLDEAFAAHQRCLEIRQKHLGPDHRDVGVSLEVLSEIRHGQGRYSEALELGERALATLEGPDATAAERASAQAVLAKLLWDGQGDRERALELARTAAATFRALGKTSRRRTQLEAWLAEHDRGP